MADTTHTEPVEFEDPHRRRLFTFWIIAAVVLVLVALGLILRRANEKSEAAQAKATRLQAAFTALGLPAPSTDQIINVLGEDGAVVCQDPEAALGQAIHFGVSTNGAGGPGMRPVYTPHQLVTGTQLVLSVYCPDQLPDFIKNINDLKLTDTVRDGTS